LARNNALSGLRLGFYCAGLILIAMVCIFVIDGHAFRDPRYHQSIPAAMVAALIIEPFKTVLFEEFAFRGVLPAIILKLKDSKRFAVLFSSVAFGLWHITSSAAIGNYRVSSSFTAGKLNVMLAAIIFTTVAGVLLCILRYRSQSLMAPIVVHWFANAAAIIFAALSWR
jgi:membrane protease YdiL (CAAX protease family)